MTTKIFNIKSALTARIIYKNISLFLNRLDKSNTLSGGAPQPPFIKIISKVVGGGGYTKVKIKRRGLIKC